MLPARPMQVCRRQCRLAVAAAPNSKLDLPRFHRRMKLPEFDEFVCLNPGQHERGGAGVGSSAMRATARVKMNLRVNF